MNARKVLDKYWPSIALVGILVLLVVLLPSNDDSGERRVSTGGGPATTAAPRAGTPGNTAGGGGGAPTTTPYGAAPTVATTRAGTTGGAGTGNLPSGGGQAAPTTPGGDPGSTPTSQPTGQSPATTLPPGAAPPPDGGGGIRPAIDPPPGDGQRPDGRASGFSPVGAPYVPLFTGDNGGATYRGVTGNSIIIVDYQEQVDPSTQAVLAAAGVSEEPEEVRRIQRVINRYFQTHIETYGREYVVIDYFATGPLDDEAAQRADAVAIAEEIGAFVCLGCPTYAAEELAARGVVSIITFETTKDQIAKTKGYLFGGLPALEEHYDDVAEYWGKRLQKLPARYSSSPLIAASERKLGLVWMDGIYGGVIEGLAKAKQFFEGELAKYNTALTADHAYNFDFARAGEQSTAIITKMRSEGVTTITIVGDGLFPIFLTREATNQAYYPEWLISGSALTDITFFGRLYDQAQWRAAFGISPLWVFWEDHRVSEGYREYHHVCPTVEPEYRRCEDGDEGVGINTYRANYGIFSIGVHLAGPNLTPETFAQGMYAFPRSGGVPHIPLFYYTPDSPTIVKDHVEVFWDPSGTGKDEVGKDGVGIMRKANGGVRYEDGEWPNTEPENDVSKSIFTTDEPYKAGQSEHDQDGHVHPPEQICRSCRHQRESTG